MTDKSVEPEQCGLDEMCTECSGACLEVEVKEGCCNEVCHCAAQALNDN